MADGESPARFRLAGVPVDGKLALLEGRHFGFRLAVWNVGLKPDAKSSRSSEVLRQRSRIHGDTAMYVVIRVPTRYSERKNEVSEDEADKGSEVSVILPSSPIFVNGTQRVSSSRWLARFVPTAHCIHVSCRVRSRYTQGRNQLPLGAQKKIAYLQCCTRVYLYE